MKYDETRCYLCDGGVEGRPLVPPVDEVHAKYPELRMHARELACIRSLATRLANL